MDELALMEAPEPSGARESGALMMEQVATTTEKLVRQRDWDELAKEQLEKIFRWGEKICPHAVAHPTTPSPPIRQPTNQPFNHSTI